MDTPFKVLLILILALIGVLIVFGLVNAIVDKSIGSLGDVLCFWCR